ncbi:MAG: hypothetical protein U5K53_07815 [Halanaerobiales bacterium]|nr:hypothetical protein [Halanaerobiales bacterium]
MLIELKQIADDNNINLKTFRPNASQNIINISIVLEANYYDLNRFIAELKRFEYWMDYNTLTIRPTDQNLQVNLSLTFHKEGLIGGDVNE